MKVVGLIRHMEHCPVDYATIVASGIMVASGVNCSAEQCYNTVIVIDELTRNKHVLLHYLRLKSYELYRSLVYIIFCAYIQIYIYIKDYIPNVSDIYIYACIYI